MVEFIQGRNEPNDKNKTKNNLTECNSLTFIATASTLLHIRITFENLFSY